MRVIHPQTHPPGKGRKLSLIGYLPSVYIHLSCVPAKSWVHTCNQGNSFADVTIKSPSMYMYGKVTHFVYFTTDNLPNFLA